MRGVTLASKRIAFTLAMGMGMGWMHSVLAAATVELLEVPAGMTTNITSVATFNNANVNGACTIGVSGCSINNLNLCGTAETPALLKFSSSNWYPIFSITSALIGSNGYPGLIDIENTIKPQTFSFYGIIIDASTQCTPGKQCIDFLNISSGEINIGTGVVNRAQHPARVTFTPGSKNRGDGELMTGASWGASMFSGGSFVMEGTAKVPMVTIVIGSGPGYNWQSYPSVTCAAGANVTLAGEGKAVFYATVDHMLLLKNITFSNAGDVVFSNLYTFVKGPTTFSNNSSTMVVNCDSRGYFDLSGHSLTGRHIRVESGAITNSSANGGLCYAPVASETHSLAGKVASTVAVTMDGEGTLELANAEVQGTLTLYSGSISVTNDAKCASAVMLGGNLVVDGCTFAVEKWTNATCAVTCINGGRVAIAPKASDGDAYLSKPHSPTNATLLKSGSNTLTVYDPESIGEVDVRGGTLRFSAYGRVGKYLKLLFSAQSVDEQPLNLGKILFWGADGSVASESLGFSSASVGQVPATPGCFSYTHPKTNVKSDSWRINDWAVFCVNSGSYNMNNYCQLASPPITNGVSSFGYLIHLANSSARVCGYDFSQTGYNWSPTDWKVMGSEDGENWEVWDQRSDMKAVTHGNCWWEGGLIGKQTLAFEFSNYLTDGASGLSDSIAVRVDAGATADFSCVTDKQKVNRITIDSAIGAGSLKNVKFATDGTLEVVNASGKKIKDVFPIAIQLTEAADIANLSKWTVSANGLTRTGGLYYENGYLKYDRGMIIFIK